MVKLDAARYLKIEEDLTIIVAGSAEKTEALMRAIQKNSQLLGAAYVGALRDDPNSYSSSNSESTEVAKRIWSTQPKEAATPELVEVTGDDEW